MNCGVIFSRMVFIWLLLLSCLEVSGQRKLIDVEEFSRIGSAAADRSRATSRHGREKRETFANGVVVKLVEIAQRGTYDGKQHSVTKTTEQSTTDETESIVIGDTLYFRRSSGTWKRSEEKLFWQPPSGKEISRTPIGRQYSIETVIQDGLQMQLLDSFLVYDENKELSFQHRQMWIREDGLVHRIEMTKGGLLPRTLLYRSSETYEYDPKIKIEAPIK